MSQQVHGQREGTGCDAGAGLDSCVEFCSGLRVEGFGLEEPLVAVYCYLIGTWEFPKIGDPNIVP